MKNEWKVTDRTLGELPCLEHRVTRELTAFGSKGCLYETGPGKYAAIRYLPSGEETILTGLTAKDLKTWKVRLEVPTKDKGQLTLANPQFYPK